MNPLEKGAARAIARGAAHKHPHNERHARSERRTSSAGRTYKTSEVKFPKKSLEVLKQNLEKAKDFKITGTINDSQKQEWLKYTDNFVNRMEETLTGKPKERKTGSFVSGNVIGLAFYTEAEGRKDNLSRELTGTLSPAGKCFEYFANNLEKAAEDFHKGFKNLNKAANRGQSLTPKQEKQLDEAKKALESLKNTVRIKVEDSASTVKGIHLPPRKGIASILNPQSPERNVLTREDVLIGDSNTQSSLKSTSGLDLISNDDFLKLLQLKPGSVLTPDEVKEFKTFLQGLFNGIKENEAKVRELANEMNRVNASMRALKHTDEEYVKLEQKNADLQNQINELKNQGHEEIKSFPKKITDYCKQHLISMSRNAVYALVTALIGLMLYELFGAEGKNTLQNQKKLAEYDTMIKQIDGTVEVLNNQLQYLPASVKDSVEYQEYMEKIENLKVKIEDLKSQYNDLKRAIESPDYSTTRISGIDFLHAELVRCNLPTDGIDQVTNIIPFFEAELGFIYQHRFVERLTAEIWGEAATLDLESTKFVVEEQGKLIGKIATNLGKIKAKQGVISRMLPEEWRKTLEKMEIKATKKSYKAGRKIAEIGDEGIEVINNHLNYLQQLYALQWFLRQLEVNTDHTRLLDIIYDSTGIKNSLYSQLESIPGWDTLKKDAPSIKHKIDELTKEHEGLVTNEDEELVRVTTPLDRLELKSKELKEFAAKQHQFISRAEKTGLELQRNLEPSLELKKNRITGERLFQ